MFRRKKNDQNHPDDSPFGIPFEENVGSLVLDIIPGLDRERLLETLHECDLLLRQAQEKSAEDVDSQTAFYQANKVFADLFESPEQMAVFTSMMVANFLNALVGQLKPVLALVKPEPVIHVMRWVIEQLEDENFGPLESSVRSGRLARTAFRDRLAEIAPDESADELADAIFSPIFGGFA